MSITDSLTIWSALLLVALLAGCSGSRLSEVTVPAERSSVQPPSLTDTVTLKQVAPVPPPGTPTAPISLERFTGARAGGEVSRVTVTDTVVQVVRSSGDLYSFDLPAYGEELDVRTAPDTTTAQVRGAPKKETVMAECPPCKEGWWGLKTEMAVLGAVLLAVGAGTVALKVAGASLVPW